MSILHIYNDSAEVCRQLAKRLAKLAQQGGTIAISGGSTPQELYALMAKESLQIDWNTLRIFWVDERMVPSNHPESNYGTFYRLMVEQGQAINPQNLYPIDGAARSETDELERINRLLPPKGVFDLILLGVGNDGHTASIFANNLQSFQSPHAVEAVSHPQTNQRRITLTGELINRAHEVIFLCTGRDKAHVVAGVIEQQNPLFPATHIVPQGICSWYLDKASAALLHNP